MDREARLSISPVETTDEGEYKCEITFLGNEKGFLTLFFFGGLGGLGAKLPLHLTLSVRPLKLARRVLIDPESAFCYFEQ